MWRCCVNNLAYVRAERVFVPSEGASEYSMALTPAVALVLEAAQTPVRCSALTSKLAAEFPSVTEHRLAALLTELLRVRLLRSALRAAATVTDPTEVLPDGLWDARAAGGVAFDVRLDAQVRLPETVAVEVETAATLLARLATHPVGTPAWQRWTERFADRYGEGNEVPVDVITDVARGLGYPEGFGTVSEPPRPMSRRDRLLLELAGAAGVEGNRSVTLSGTMIEELEAATDRPQNRRTALGDRCTGPGPSLQALDRGDFRLRVTPSPARPAR